LLLKKGIVNPGWNLHCSGVIPLKGSFLMCFKRLAAFAVALSLPAFAFAEVASKPGPLDIDANKDGKISKSEFVDGMVPQIRERLSQRFDMLDANKDGQLDDAEMNGNRPMRQMAPGMQHHGMDHGGTMPAPGMMAPEAPKQ
jgi:hypothetical protein